MKGYFIIIAVLNIIDAFATAGGIKLKVIAEANPIMNCLCSMVNVFAYKMDRFLNLDL